FGNEFLRSLLTPSRLCVVD
ncbi:hypothetical protein D049_2538B, partial [Vibrio parahaemolyticus VPTS-2010]